jgi:type II secretory pathway component GspD/PulD (secretin)
MDCPRRILPLLGSLIALSACLAPRPGAAEGEAISAEEAGRRLAAGGTPVTGEVVDGRVVPEEDAGLALPDAAALEPKPVLDVPDEPRENPYLRFGERILVHALGGTGEAVITKPYPLPPGKGEDMVHLIQALQPFPYKSVSLEQAPEAGEPDPQVVELLLLPGWDKENITDPKPGPTSKPPDKGMVLSDMLVVTAGYERLEEVEDFINLFAAGVRQIEIEAKIVEVVESDLMDIGIKPVPGLPIFDFPEGTFVDSLDYSLPNSVDPTEALLTLGAVQDGLAFNAILEALESFSNVSIDQRPKVAVREGVSASIASTEEIPFYEIGSINPSGNFSSALKFKSVGIELYVTPRVVGTETLALDVHVIASQRVGSVPTFTLTGEALDTPLIATRTAKTVVYLKPGQALIIGGLTAERATQVINQVPILGDIPILGLLFRSKRDTTEKAYSMFVISPRIIQGNEFNASL